jgi:hypothetical protein
MGRLGNIAGAGINCLRCVMIDGCGNSKDNAVDIQAPPLVTMGREVMIAATLDNPAGGDPSHHE